MEHLIVKYLQNDLTKAEALELKAWLEKDPLNRKVFENIVGEWNLSGADIKASKERILKKIMSDGQTVVGKASSGRSWYLARIAAVLLIGVGLAFIMWVSGEQFWSINTTHDEAFLFKEASRGQKLTFELPDGSIVNLNSGSKLIYPSTFTGKTREVSLTGEAFFKVARDEKHPFRIATEELDIEVLGTSFNVRSYPGDRKAVVAVKTGKVAVSSKDLPDQMVLMPRQAAVYEASIKSFSKEPVEDEKLFFGWIDQELNFRDLEIQEILKIVSRWYDVEFAVEADLNAAKLFTASYKNPSLRTVMESLSYAYEFEYDINKKIVTIK